MDCKEINSEYPLKGLILRLKLQYFGHLMHRVESLKKTLMLGKIEGRRRRGRHRCNGHGLGQTSGDDEGQRGLVCCSPRGREESDATRRLNYSNSAKVSVF